MLRYVLKNSSYIFLAQSLVKLVSFFYTVFLARSLGVDNFGFFTVALAYFSLIAAVADLGFNRFLIREGARAPERLPTLTATSVVLRLAVSCSIFAVFALWLYLVDKNSLRVSLSLLAVMAIIPQSIALTLDAALIAKEKLKASAAGLLGLSFSTTAFGVYLIYNHFSSFGAVGALILGELVYVILLLFSLHGNGISIRTACDEYEIPKIIKGSLPYGILAVLGLLYFRVDTLFLSYMRGAYETGLYGVSYKFLEAVVFVPSALTAALFPVLSRSAEDKALVKKLYFSSLKFLGLTSIPILLGYIFILPLIIKYFLPQYMASISAIYILSLTIPFMFIHIPAALVLMSSDKYLKSIIFLSLGTLTFNVAANILVIPTMGYIGASIITVLSEIVSFVVFFVYLQLKVFRSYD